jgi:hypothetical protein
MKKQIYRFKQLTGAEISIGQEAVIIQLGLGLQEVRVVYMRIINARELIDGGGKAYVVKTETQVSVGASVADLRYDRDTGILQLSYSIVDQGKNPLQLVERFPLFKLGIDLEDVFAGLLAGE